MINLLKLRNKIMKESDYKLIEIRIYFKDDVVLHYNGIAIKFNLLKLYACDMVKFYNHTNFDDVYFAASYLGLIPELFGEIYAIHIMIKKNDDYIWKIYREGIK